MSWLDEAEREKQERALESKLILRPTMKEIERINDTLEQCLPEMAERTWEKSYYSGGFYPRSYSGLWEVYAYMELRSGSPITKKESYIVRLFNNTLAPEGVPILELGTEFILSGRSSFRGLPGQFYERLSQLDDVSIKEALKRYYIHGPNFGTLPPDRPLRFPSHPIRD